VPLSILLSCQILRCLFGRIKPKTLKERMWSLESKDMTTGNLWRWSPRF
jgi:hypothetical protein